MASNSDDDLLSRGFDAGNYANAYTSTDLQDAWEAECDEAEENDDYDRVKSEAFHGAFVIGFFGSYELHEIPEDARDDYDAAIGRFAPRMREIGIAVDVDESEDA